MTPAPNGVKLVPKCLVGQKLTQSGARFDASGAQRIDDQVGQFVTGRGGGQPTERFDEADSLRRHALSASGFVHRHPDQVMNQQEHRQFLQYAADRLATKHVDLHRGLQMAKASFDSPSQTVRLGHCSAG